MRFWILLLLAGAVFAQDGDDNDDGCGCGEDVEITIDGDGSEDGAMEIKVDPFDEEADDAEEPNRPDSVKVGSWQPPDLGPEARTELTSLLGMRGDGPDDVGLRYRLAEFYLKHAWWPQAEAEFLACAALDPESIRPWEGALRVYRDSRVPADRFEAMIRRFRIQGGIVIVDEGGGRRRQDWLKSDGDKARMQRISHAYQEILKRRPDDVARRRVFVAHLKEARDYANLVVQARAILARLPDDVQTRYELAEAMRKLGRSKDLREDGSGRADRAEAFRLMEENLTRAPDHAPTLLRLARMLGARDGHEAADRIAELEKRGFFSIFIVPDIEPVPFRADTYRMARDLVGPGIAGRLWDDLFVPDWYRNRPVLWSETNTIYYRRWLNIYFPHARPRDRLLALEKLGRRADREAIGILLAFLWHLEGPDAYAEEDVERRTAAVQVEVKACAVAAAMGSVAYPGAERLLKRADDPRRRRRGVRILADLKDPRALRPLVDTLEHDTAEEFSLGTAAALEALGDADAVDGLVHAALDVRRPLARRVEATEALAAFQDPRCIEGLRRLFSEQGFGIVAAYGLLRLTGADDALPVLQRALGSEEDSAEVVRLLAKCDDPRTEELLLDALARGSATIRPRAIELLRARYWRSARPRVHGILLAEASAPSVSDETLELLREFPSKETADRLLPLCETLTEKRWALAARALAETGDERAVRYFARMKVLEKRSDRRRLARDLHELAAYRQAQRESASGARTAPGGG